MKEINLYQDKFNKISIFPDNHQGVVIQLFRTTEGLVKGDNGEMVTQKHIHPISTHHVTTKDKDDNIKNPDLFKKDVKLAIDRCFTELKDVMACDTIIEGVLNDYESQRTNRSKQTSKEEKDKIREVRLKRRNVEAVGPGIHS